MRAAQCHSLSNEHPSLRYICTVQAFAQRNAHSIALKYSCTGRCQPVTWRSRVILTYLLAQVYRDQAGKRVTLEELRTQQAANKKPVAETPVWGGGMAQQRAAEQRRQEMHAEAAKPFARRRYQHTAACLATAVRIQF